MVFSFEEHKDDIIEECISIDDARDRYPDKYMAIRDIHIENSRLVGTIVALFSAEEYYTVSVKEKLGGTYGVWGGWDIISNVGRLGFYG